MAYIGNQSATAFTSFDKQIITGNGGTTYTLSHAVANEQEIEVFVNNVRQEGGSGKAFTVSGNQITFTGAVASSDSCYVNFQGKAIQTVVPPDGSVGTAKIANGSVTAAKLAAGVQGVAGITTASTSGTAMSIDSSNRITTPARPAFSARGSGSWIDVADNTTAVIAMTIADVNVGSCYSTSTYKFTAPVAGLYQLQCNVYLKNNGGTASDSGTYGYVKMQKNGSNIAGLESIHGYLNNGDADQTQHINGLVSLAVGDEVTLVMSSYGGGISSYNRNNTSFHGYLVG